MWCNYDQTLTKQTLRCGVSHCCSPSWSLMHIKQMGEQRWGMHSMESASINLLIYSMWHPSCLRTYPLPCSQYDYSERKGKRKALVVMLPGSKNCPNSSQACQTQQHIHSLGLSVDSIPSGTFWFCLLLCPFSYFGILLKYCLHVLSVLCQETACECWTSLSPCSHAET